jgi:hypothetical protein
MQEPSTYKLVFDVAREGYRYWWFPAAGLIGVAGGTLDLLAAMHAAKRPRRALIIITASLLWIAGTFASTYSEYRSLRSALLHGNYQEVEGPVQDFVPGDGRRPESFQVAGHRYSYSWSVVDAGYNGGAGLEPGVQVRIADVHGEIARLEVKR